MPPLNEIRARVRAAHLLVRSAAEWDTLSTELLRAYDSKDNELVERLQPIYLAAWKSVTRNILADTFEAAGIAIFEATHPWGIATLEAAGLSCEPLLCSRDELPDPAGTPATYGGLYLRSFEEVMAGYDMCVTYLADAPAVAPTKS